MSQSEVPTKAPRRAEKRAPSVVLVNTGDGKGKSTAAFGTVLRAVARGWKVCVIQFIKSGKWKVGEQQSATALGVEWWTIGDGFTWDSKDMERSEAIAREAWKVSKQKITSGLNGRMFWKRSPTPSIGAGYRSQRWSKRFAIDRPP